MKFSFDATDRGQNWLSTHWLRGNRSPSKGYRQVSTKRSLISIFTILIAVLPGCGGKRNVEFRGPVADWPAYGNDPGGSRYSPLTQITKDNVSRLKVAWIYRTGDVSAGKTTARKTSFEATPIQVGGLLYVVTPFNRVIALDPESGKERWSYDPKIDFWIYYGDDLICRGVSSWADSDSKGRESCRRRIFVATNDARLIALDAATGIPCVEFGNKGQVDISRDVGFAYPGEYHMTSPPVVIGDIIVVGSAISDNQRVDAPRGVVHAFDVRTGIQRWSWDPVPRNSKDPAWETWKGDSASRTGAANAWSILSADPARDTVFVPTGSASPDFYGGERLGSNLYSSSVVALRATTGEVLWDFSNSAP